MNIPIMLALVTLACRGIGAFFSKVAGTQQVYVPSYLTVASAAVCLVGIAIHIVQRHPFELSAKMSGLASLQGILGGIGFFAILLAFRLGGQGSILLPIAALTILVSVPLTFIVYREPVTATKLVGFGFGITSIIFLTR